MKPRPIHLLSLLAGLAAGAAAGWFSRPADPTWWSTRLQSRIEADRGVEVLDFLQSREPAAAVLLPLAWVEEKVGRAPTLPYIDWGPQFSGIEYRIADTSKRIRTCSDLLGITAEEHARMAALVTEVDRRLGALRAAAARPERLDANRVLIRMEPFDEELEEFIGWFEAGLQEILGPTRGRLAMKDLSAYGQFRSPQETLSGVHLLVTRRPGPRPYYTVGKFRKSHTREEILDGTANDSGSQGGNSLQCPWLCAALAPYFEEISAPGR